MTTYPGGTRVQSGYYVNPGAFAFANVERSGGALPGGPETRWRRVPALLLVAAAPVVGGLFLVTFPIVGAGVAVYAVARALGGKARHGVREVAATVAPTWRPGEAHLTGKPADQGTGAAPAARDEQVEGLEREVGERRSRKE